MTNNALFNDFKELENDFEYHQPINRIYRHPSIVVVKKRKQKTTNLSHKW